MTGVFSITIPIFLLIAVGHLAFRFRMMEPAHTRALGAFVLNFALPALIVRSLSDRRPAEIVNARYLVAYGGASLAVFAIVFVIARFVRGSEQTRSAIQALGASVSNSGFIGYPVAALVLGAPAGVALSLNMLFENMALIPLALALAEAGMGKGAGIAETIRRTASRLIRNPLIIAISVGTALAFSGLSLPGVLVRAIDMLASASAAVALFAIGGALVGLSTHGLLGDVALVVAGKLLLHPLAVVGALSFFPALDPTLRKAALIFASVPMITIYPLLGEAYGQGRLSAAALVAATSISFVTISLLLYVL